MSQQQPSYRIIGKVTDKNSGTGIQGLLVKAWDADLILNDLVGSAPTDAEGIFVMEFDETYFREIFLDRKPDLFFEIYYKGKCIFSTQNEIICNLSPGEHQINLEIDLGLLEETPPDKPVFPDPRQFPGEIPDNPVNPGKSIPPPAPGKWRDEINEWWRDRKQKRREDGTLHIPKRPIPKPYLDCSSKFGPQLRDLAINEVSSMSFQVWNDGNFPAWTCYVELYEGPAGYNSPLSAYELRGRKIISLRPGERMDVSVPWVRKKESARVFGIVFDPLLDPKDFQLVEQRNRHITSIHYSM